MENLDEIVETIQSLYIKNINFFKNYDIDIYKKISAFEKLNVENYSLEFIDNHFEIVDKDGNKLYNRDPFYDAEYRANEIVKKELSNLFTINRKKREILTTDKYDSNLFINQFIELIENKEDMNSFNKFVFIGTLLGVHINNIDDVVNCDSYLLIEENIEIFRLSLFFTDYEKVLKKSKIFFSISENKDRMAETIKDFFNFNYEDNYLLKFEIVNEQNIKLFEYFVQEFLKYNPTIYPFSEIIVSYVKGIENFRVSKNGVLDLSKKVDILSDYPCLFLAPGPSLSKNIEEIKKSTQKVLIACSIGTLKELEKSEIVPDIILSLDSNEVVIKFLEKITSKYYENSIILTSINTDSKVINKLNHDRAHLFQNSLELFPGFGSMTGVGTGDIGVKVLLHLGVKELYICGIDAAMDQLSGKTHSDAYVLNNSRKLKEGSIFDEECEDLLNMTIKVKGNFEDEVYSTVHYQRIIEAFKSIEVPNDANIYNTSSGAYLYNTVPTEYKEVLSRNSFDKDLNSINNDLQKIVKKELSEIDTLTFKKELEACKSLNIEAYPTTIVFKIIEEYNILIKPYINFLINNYNIDKTIVESLEKKQKSIILYEIGKVVETLLDNTHRENYLN